MPGKTHLVNVGRYRIQIKGGQKSVSAVGGAMKFIDFVILANIPHEAEFPIATHGRAVWKGGRYELGDKFMEVFTSSLKSELGLTDREVGLVVNRLLAHLDENEKFPSL